jgi:hypothetical protein
LRISESTLNLLCLALLGFLITYPSSIEKMSIHYLSEGISTFGIEVNATTTSGGAPAAGLYRLYKYFGRELEWEPEESDDHANDAHPNKRARTITPEAPPCPPLFSLQTLAMNQLIKDSSGVVAVSELLSGLPVPRGDLLEAFQRAVLTFPEVPPVSGLDEAEIEFIDSDECFELENTQNNIEDLLEKIVHEAINITTTTTTTGAYSPYPFAVLRTRTFSRDHRFYGEESNHRFYIVLKNRTHRYHWNCHYKFACINRKHVVDTSLPDALTLFHFQQIIHLLVRIGLETDAKPEVLFLVSSGDY